MRISSDSFPLKGQKPLGKNDTISAKDKEKPPSAAAGAAEDTPGAVTLGKMRAQVADSGIEGVAAREGGINDMGMARRMIESIRNGILSNPPTAILAQANTTPQGVLQFVE